MGGTPDPGWGALIGMCRGGVLGKSSDSKIMQGGWHPSGVPLGQGRRERSQPAASARQKRASPATG